MKSKLFKVLGVVAVVAMLATSLVAPIAAMSGVSASVTAGSAVIGAVGNYTVNATLGTQLLGTNGVSVTLPYVGETVRFTAAAATDKVAIAITGTIPTVAFGGGGTYTGGVVAFGTTGDTVTFTTVAASTVITYTKTVGNATVTTTDISGAPTCSATPGAFTLPDVGDTIVFTSVGTSDVVTLSVTTGLNVVFSGTGGTYAAGVITFAAVAGQTATVSSTNAQVAGTWTRTGTATGAAGTNVAHPVVIGAAAANGDTITISFPTGFTIGAPTGGIAASAGWVTVPPATTPSYIAANITAATTFSFSGQNIVITLGAGDYIGAGAQIFVNITAGVTNPSTAGSFTLTVKTSQETTAVTSNSFTISNPVIIPLPGVATVYNTAGVLMSQSNSLTTALGAVGAGGTIKLSAGTYNTALGTITVACTIQGTDASAANVVIKSVGAWAMTGATVVIDKVTIDGSTGALTMTNATAGTISNSNLQGAVVTFNGAGTNTLDTDTVTVLTGANGVAAATPTTVKNSTFSVAGTGVGLAASNNVTVSGSTFTGVAGAGTGVALIGGAASVIGTSKFSTLTTALSVVGATTGASFNGDTVDKCGVATTGPDAIMVTSTSGLTVSNNNITNSLEYIINVAANDNLVTVMANQFSGNTKNAIDAANAVVGTPLNVTHNYWGGTAANPASVTTAPLISYAMPLGAVPTSGSIEVGAASLDASATAGVVISAAVGSTTLGAVRLGANPVTTALPSTVTAKSYYDVFGVGTVVTATIQFNGTTAAPIAATDLVYMWNTIYGRWDVLATGANAYGNYVTITGANISGTVFALVTLIPTVPPVPGDITPQYPEDGAVNVPINVTFTWASVAGATGYQFAIAQDNPDLTNKFAVLDYSANTITNAHIVQETLLYNTTYWWEVRSVAGTVYSPWTIVSFFTTEKAPVATSTTTAPPITIVQTTVTYTNPPVTTTIFTLPQQKGTQPIPSYLLWAVIAVGAVLVIAVIVLIVRTRRMP